MPVRAMTILILCLSIIGCADDRHDERLAAAGANPTLAGLLHVADVDAGRRKVRACLACHTIGKGAPDNAGPNLYGIFGRTMGTHSPRYGYTAALIAAGGKWDAATLDIWIANPRRLVPGTKMQFSGVADPLDRADIIIYLRSQAD